MMFLIPSKALLYVLSTAAFSVLMAAVFYYLIYGRRPRPEWFYCPQCAEFHSAKGHRSKHPPVKSARHQHCPECHTQLARQAEGRSIAAYLARQNPRPAAPRWATKHTLAK